MLKSLIRIVIAVCLIAVAAWPFLPQERKQLFSSVLKGESDWRQLALVNPFTNKTITRAEPLVAGLTKTLAQSELGREFLATMHMPQEYRCERVVTRDIKDKDQNKLYRWQDEKGRWHFGDDKRLVGANAQDLSAKYQSKYQYFKLDLRGDDKQLPVFGRDKISAETTQIFEVLSDALSVDYLRQVDLNIRLLASQSDFQAHLQKIAPSLKTSSGFYSSQNNEAVIWLAPDIEFTHGVIRHESSHVIMAGLYGSPPVWLNEGVAEYFERLNVSSNSKVVSPNVAWLQDLTAGGSMPLAAYFALDTKQWRSLPQQKMYGMAWGVVYFLMSEPHRKQFLATMLTSIAHNKCQTFATLDYVNAHYPQGVAGMDIEWQQWLQTKPSPHYY